MTVAGGDDRYVVNVLTGFLGSGKTTLLQRLLHSDAFARCAVLVNELGDIALDHELLEQIDQETVVLRSGCICCGVRTDMAETLLELNARRDRGEIPPFDRVVIETTGLADPVPVINTILSDAALKHHFRLGTVVTTVDAVHGAGQLQARPESRKQAGVADRIVITKADLVSPQALDAVRAAVTAVNPHCAIVESYDDASEAEVAMASDLSGDGRLREVDQWFAPGRVGASAGAAEGAVAAGDTGGSGGVLDDGGGLRGVAAASLGGALFAPGGRPLASLHGGIRSVTLTFDEPLDWTAFGIWLSMLLHRHGATILRVKGILNLQGVAVPTVVHGVQHLLHPPVHLSAWPGDDRRSRLVLIGELPDAQTLQRSLELFGALGKR